MVQLWIAPEGLRVARDGSWWVGDEPVRHTPTLFYFKRHLVFDEDGAYVAEGRRRAPVALEGPPFRVQVLVLDPVAGQASAGRDVARTIHDVRPGFFMNRPIWSPHSLGAARRPRE
jgi:hypothetical protein